MQRILLEIWLPWSKMRVVSVLFTSQHWIHCRLGGQEFCPCGKVPPECNHDKLLWDEIAAFVSGIPADGLYPHVVRKGESRLTGLLWRCGEVVHLHTPRDFSQDNHAGLTRLGETFSVLAGAPDSVVCTSPDGAILAANAAWLRMYGFEPNDVSGRNPRIINARQQSPEFYVDFWK